MITTIAGGVGAARMLSALQRVVPSDELTAIVNVADDTRVNGLAVSPDLDTVTYTLAGAIDPERGWGLEGESWAAMEALGAYGSSSGRDDIGWFNLGDRDLGTHLYRTTRLAEGAPLSEVTAEVARRWEVDVTVLPVSDDLISTRVRVVDGDEIGFQDYFVRRRHDVAVEAVRFDGIGVARPAPGVIESIETADIVLIAPSNPIVSIAPVLEVGGVRDAVRARRSRCVAVSPIVGGAALKGPADRLMRELGHEPGVVGVARAYAGDAAVLVIDDEDADHAAAVAEAGMIPLVTPTVMSRPGVAEGLARAVLGAVG